MNEFENQLNLFFLGLMKRHFFWYEHLSKWCNYMEIMPPVLPEFGVYQKVSRQKANPEFLFGYYHPSYHGCNVNLVTALASAWSEVDNTIAHEMCHAFQRAIVDKIGKHSPYADGRMAKFGDKPPFFSHDALFHVLMAHCRLKIAVQDFDHNKARAYEAIFRGKKFPEFLIKTTDHQDTVGMFSAGKDFYLMKTTGWENYIAKS